MLLKRTLLLVLMVFFFLQIDAYGQQTESDSVDLKIRFSGDLRPRLEHDWNGRKSDGTYRTDRSRARYRLRVGFDKNIDKNFRVGARIRSGSLSHQQDANITLGGNTPEFETAQFGIERVYLRYETKRFWTWVGKHDYPFWRQNAILWNNNVYPEGFALGLKPKEGSKLVFKPVFGHFILRTSDHLFRGDSYLTSLQASAAIHINPQHKLTFNLGELYFHQAPDIPDGNHTQKMDYNIMTSSIRYRLDNGKRPLFAGMDFYLNTRDYTNKLEVFSELEEEKSAVVFNLQYGELAKKGDFTVHFYYTQVGKHAIVDYIAQSDWGRWDYSEYGSPAFSLSNFKGFEIRAGYNIRKNVNVVASFFKIEQIVATGPFKETGDRFRLDINASF